MKSDIVDLNRSFIENQKHQIEMANNLIEHANGNKEVIRLANELIRSCEKCIEIEQNINKNMEIKSIELIKNERIRQIIKEGYSFDHDDQEYLQQLSYAAVVYACHSSARHSLLHLWPWDKEYFKPDKDNTIDGRIKELTKAGALICAEIDRLIRLKTRFVSEL